MTVAQTIAATERGIRKADASVSEEWKAAAAEAMAYCVATFEKFTADDVWTRLDHEGIARPRVRSALGPAFRRAAAAGHILNTHEWKKHSEYPQRHRELLIWRSVR